MSKFGYGYSKVEFCTLRTYLVVYLGLRKRDDVQLGQKWVDGFLRRNRDIKAKEEGQRCPKRWVAPAAIRLATAVI